MIKNHIKHRLSAMEEVIMPKDTLGYVRFLVTFSDGSNREMDARELFGIALIRDVAIAECGEAYGTILPDDPIAPLPYIDYQVIRGSWSDLPHGIVRSQIRSTKGV